MSNKRYRDRSDVLNALAMLDFELNKFNLKSKIELIVFGGVALLLQTSLHVTGDIDAIIRLEKEDIQIRKLLAKYSINDKMVGLRELPPEDEVEEEALELNVDFKNIIVKLPSVEHLIISKLFVSRQTDKDVDDIINSGILDQANIELLKEMYNDYKDYAFFPPRAYNQIDEVLKKWREKKEG